MFRRCCGGKKNTNKSDSRGHLKASADTLSADTRASTPQPVAIDRPLAKKLNASVNDVRNNDNNTVLVQFQEDVVPATDDGGALKLGIVTGHCLE